MNRFVIDLNELDQDQLALAGGKGANLGALMRIDGIRVPPGFCVTTEAYRTRRLSGPVAAGIEAALRRHGFEDSYAVRSSATAEDLPTASFAGQQDSFLDVAGLSAILEAIEKCWASLFTERAVAYRRKNGIDESQVSMAVVVQRMVHAQAAGVLFTADPMSGNRRDSVIEAVRGLGDALVSGHANADSFTVRDGSITSTVGAASGARAITDRQAIELAALGRRIEAHFGRPQDVEWCLDAGQYHIVQSRPITTLFPIPEVKDGKPHVWVSTGHQQMMTDPMKPLGLSLWDLTTARPFAVAAGRLYVDISQMLAMPSSRAKLIELFGKGDPLVHDAVQTVIDRGFIPDQPDGALANPLPSVGPAPLEADPAIVVELIRKNDDSLAIAAREIATKSGVALFEFILEDLKELQKILFDPKLLRVIMSAVDATAWLNEKMREWLGEKQAADTLTLSAEGNVTSEMGLALLDVADVIRPHPEVIAHLEATDDDRFLERLASLPGGVEAARAIEGWLEKYGMRGVGEIDITRPRWSEQPRLLIPLLLGNIRNVAPGDGKRRFDEGAQLAAQKEAELLSLLRARPDGEERAAETKRVIDRLRTFVGYREYPKYGKICRYFLYKSALMREADRLVQARVIRSREDIFFLGFHELAEVVRSQRADHALIDQRRAEFESFRALMPPRILTSEGECLNGAYRRDDAPAGAQPGLAVSAGVVEGRARVILSMEEADLEPGDILVTRFTDPSWTPLFVSIKGVITEIGGLMTHGAVIAREYGLPAVVGVVGATTRIRDGQRIRLNGTDGYVELLD